LRFHTGCRLVDEAPEADFVWATFDEMPALSALAQGSDERPEGSATCLVDATVAATGLADAANTSACFILRGPGIRDTFRLRIGGLAGESAAAFADAWAANQEVFPKGVDLFLATPRHLVGLPRTTRIELET
jgi:alpha-D-ribose 1-methylphosphonate 5-triphosphate synthase subunit PhnH